MAGDFDAEDMEADNSEVRWANPPVPLTEYEERMNYWRLCDELTVIQAAALIVGIDPSDETGANCDHWSVHQQPKGYAAAKSALMHAILGGRLKAEIRRTAFEKGFVEDPGDDWSMTNDVGFHADDYPMIGAMESSIRAFGVIYRPDLDWNLTTVSVEALREWLTIRGFRTGFFFPQAIDAPDYLDPQNKRYAPKLAAAIRAWLAVDDPKGKSPKQALVKWLRENSAQFDLSDDEGKPNEQGIEECAKVANWQPAGGSPKTPGT